MSHAEDDLGFEKYSVLEPVEARGRLVAYAAAHMSFHGAIVTERFDFTKDGEYLAEFLWRFNHLSYAQRGHDPSVVAASAAEKALADEHGLRTTHYFLISVPSLTECKLVVTGRASFGDIALDLQTKKKVWLKDLWRIALDEIEKEYEVYAKLRAKHVPNVAELVCGGDVVGGSTKELVRVVRDALIAHWEAFSRADILHCDVSGGNILIVQKNDGTTHGVLIDWDLSKEATARAQARIEWRTGTWRFMSAAILGNKDKFREYCDDLESFDHVITYHILRFRPSTLKCLRSSMEQIYDSTIREEGSDEVFGGEGKRGFFSYYILYPPAVLRAVMPPHIAGLLNDLRRPFHFFYALDCELGADYTKKEEAEKQVRSATHYLEILDKYLAMDGWAKDDSSEDQLESLQSASALLRKRKRPTLAADPSSTRLRPKGLKRFCRLREFDESLKP
ncbi:hypothetical protein EVG20_g8119 [Dentipellis fragilis]|uniref:Fungal-type protein kinase domain-containing protein n=1 Tax=Dentipellis fragilis TaxID=205917 RepID=A0A4Y9Y7N1_9AGAM|nr:hypothetical protein EVG20_g8119 [Dentipellis fragilis]